MLRNVDDRLHPLTLDLGFEIGLVQCKARGIHLRYSVDVRRERGHAERNRTTGLSLGTEQRATLSSTLLRPQ